MTDEVIQGQGAPAGDPAPGSDNPMLHRNTPAPGAEGVPPAPPVAPPAAEPVAPEKPQSQMQQRASAVDALGSIAEDPQLKPIGDFLLQKLGDKADPERAFGNAIKYGDVDLIDAAYLQEVLGDDAAQVAELAKSLFTAIADKAQSVVQAVFTEHGGEAVVKQAIQFYNAKASADERAAMGLLLDSGSKASISYAMKQIMDFATKAGGVRVQAPGVMPVGQPGAQRGLSAAEYQKQVGEAHRKGAPDAEFDRLGALRKLGKSQGL